MHALLLASLLITAPGPRIIEDDYTAALAAARSSKRLLFVDAWAPWCHTCVFMREHVLTRPAFAALEKDVVFAAVDTEKAGSAAFLERFPVEVWPTLFFIDPVTEKVVLKWVGSADEAQMAALLRAARGGRGAVGEADALLASGRAPEAARRYQAATQAAASDDKARAVLSMLSALYLARDHATCARTAVEQLPVLTTPADRINGITWGLGCALELPAGPERERVVTALVREATAGLTLKGVLADDMSGLYDLLVEERRAAGDAAGAKALGARWLAFLEAEAAAARTPPARAVFDAHRVGAALAAGEPAQMVAPLLQSEKELPRDYNPPARLALIYRELGRYDDALAAIERALRVSEGGPRRIRLYETKAGILEKKGDTAGRRRVLEEALAYARKLPRSQVTPQRIAALEKQL